MARRRQRRRRVRLQKGGFYNGYNPVIVNKGINPRSWDNYGPRGYLQRGGGGQKKPDFWDPESCGLGASSFANWINKQEKKPSSYHKQKGRKWR